MTNKIEIRDVTKTFKEGDILKRGKSLPFWDRMVPEKVRHYEYFWVWIGHLQELL